jgi:hypothetical protein
MQTTLKSEGTIAILQLHRTNMLAQVLQIFLGKEHLVKNWLISTLDKVIYFKGTIFRAVYKTSLHFTKLGEDQQKKLPFLSTCVFWY